MNFNKRGKQDASNLILQVSEDSAKLWKEWSVLQALIILIIVLSMPVLSTASIDTDDKTCIDNNPICLNCTSANESKVNESPIFKSRNGGRIECSGGVVSSKSTAEHFRGCTIINGSLTIKAQQCEQNIADELEQSLSDIEEIKGSLIVTGSYPLLSLYFLKNLKKIRGIGDTSYGLDHALYVTDNKNLRSLFDHKVIIEQGKLFFHLNPKLCISKIEVLKRYVYDLKDIEQFDVRDVSPNTNGDTVVCGNIRSLKSVASTKMTEATVNIEAMKYDDNRTLLRYELYYKPAVSDNVVLDDTCSDDKWTVQYVEDFDRSDVMVQVVLRDLKPFTSYAYYVKTRTISSDEDGGQTRITYFKTLPGEPNPVQNLKLTATGSSSMIASWLPPETVNGLLSNYIVRATLIPNRFEQRNYCQEPLTTSELTSSQREVFESVVGTDHLQYRISHQPRQSKLVNGYYEEYFQNITDTSAHSFVLDNLRPFAMYSVSVQACREISTNNLIDCYPCSKRTSVIERTLKLDNMCRLQKVKNKHLCFTASADDIEYITVRKITTEGSALSQLGLQWPEPKNPNGIIVSYTIAYRRVDKDLQIEASKQCFTQQLYKNLSGEIPLLQLPDGNYTVQVRAASLAGYGNWTPPVYILLNEHRTFLTGTNLLIILCVLLGLTIAVYGALFYWRRHYNTANLHKNLEIVVPLKPKKNDGMYM